MLPLVLFILPSVLAAAVPHIARGASNQWVPIFGAAPANHENTPTSQINTPGSVFNGTDAFLVNSTIRETFRVSQGTDQLRITVTNRFGSTDLNLDAMTVAIPSPDVPGARAIDAGSLKTVTFQGNSSIKVPPGADWVSDPIFLTVVDGCEISVSTYSASGIARPDLTVHWTGANTAYYVNGDYTQDAAFDGPNLYNDTSSYYVFTVDGWLPTSTGVIACIGDSITDGFQSTPNTNGRWPDRLSERINADSSAGRYSVVDMGISGNRVLTDNGYFGQNLLGRLDHDLLSLPGVTHTILLEGINDLNGGRNVGKLPSAASLIQAYQLFITRAHIRGIAVIGGTITPTAVPAGVNYTTTAFAPSSNAIRLELNDWIRNSGAFDYVVDFDMAVRNASYPDQMQNQYASSDWLHPNNVGYQAMADTFDLSVFGRLKGNVDNYA